MKLRPMYWKLCIIWLLVGLPAIYYGVPYGGGDFNIRFEGLVDFLTWLVAVAILVFPLVGIPFFLQRRD